MRATVVDSGNRKHIEDLTFPAERLHVCLVTRELFYLVQCNPNVPPVIIKALPAGNLKYTVQFKCSLVACNYFCLCMYVII